MCAYLRLSARRLFFMIIVVDAAACDSMHLSGALIGSVQRPRGMISN